jgi:hypothetical protein
MSNIVTTPEKQTRSRIFDPFAGGRFLMSIARNQNITADETLVLLIIGSLQDFSDILHSKRYVPIDKLSYLSKRSRRTIQYVLKSLEEKKYLIIQDCYKETGKQLSNEYSLSDLIFEEAKLEYDTSIGSAGAASHKLTEGAGAASPGVQELHSQIPNKDVPKKKKGNNKLLPKKDSASASPLVSGKATRPRNKKWERRNCLDRGIETFTPDCTGDRFMPNPGRRCIELFIGEMYDVHGYDPLKAVFDDLKQNGLRGKVMFNRDNISASFKEAACRLRGEEPQDNTEVPRNPDPGF